MPMLPIRRTLLGSPSAAGYDDKVLGYGPYAYWPLSEASGVAAVDLTGNGCDGTYDGVTLGQPGIGDGATCPLFDGINDLVAIGTATLQGLFTGAQGSCLVWHKNDGGAGADRDVIHIWDWPNEIFLWHQSWAGGANNQVVLKGSVAQVTWVTTFPATWTCDLLTWDESVNEAKFYRGGVQQGATLTGWGAWVGTFAPAYTLIGSQHTSHTRPWKGWIAKVALFNFALPPEAAADLAVV